MDKLMVGEFTAASRASAHAHLATCSRCTARFNDLDAARTTYLQSAPPLTRRTAVASPNATAIASSSSRSGLRMRLPASAKAVAFGGALAIAAMTTLFLQSRPDVPDGVRLKGSERMTFFVKRGPHVTEGVTGMRVYPGDLLRFAYTARAPRYLAIFSLDGAGKASVYSPEAGETSAFVAAGDSVALPTSTLLDDTLGEEVLFGIFCDAPLPLEAVRRGIEADPSRTPAPVGCSVGRQTLDKRARP